MNVIDYSTNNDDERSSITHSLEMSMIGDEQEEFVHKNADKQYMNLLKVNKE